MFNDIERERAERTVSKLLTLRHAPHVKSGGVVVCRIRGQSIEIVSERTLSEPSTVSVVIPIAKFRFVRTAAVWQLFWSRANGKWQGYQPLHQAEDLSVLVDEVWEDPNYCFWG